MSARDVEVGISAWALLVSYDVPTEEPINADHLATIAVEVAETEGWSVQEAAKKVAATYLRERVQYHQDVVGSFTQTADVIWVNR